ncbi:MAG: molybdate ABC transporter substrate-binding protein [Lachnospiraceae bacterium]|nr:molybdate ABC transporter substrate-binding protein [Lachnospiraceae bacterium]
MGLKHKILIFALLAAVCFTSCGRNEGKDSADPGQPEKVMLTVAAAASLKNVFENELIPAFNRQFPDIAISGVYDSSGRLQTQIEEGLEADIFFSAATKQMNALNDGGKIISSTIRPLLENKIVLITGADPGNDLTEKLKVFTDIVNADTIAIGDPESVPAGQYAKEAFVSLGIWEDVIAKASLGTNVTEVLTWVAEGSAQAGVVYATDAASQPKVRVIAEAPEGALKKPVIYPVAQVAAGRHPEEAGLLLEFLAGEEASGIFERYGFTVNK